MTADNLEYVDATRKRIGHRAEAISREWLTVAVLASDSLSVRSGIDRLAPFGFVVRRIGREFNEPVQQSSQANLRNARHGEHRAQFALRDSVVDVWKNVFLVRVPCSKYFSINASFDSATSSTKTLARFVDDVAAFGRNVNLFCLTIGAKLVSFHVDHVHHATKIFLFSDR